MPLFVLLLMGLTAGPARCPAAARIADQLGAGGPYTTTKCRASKDGRLLLAGLRSRASRKNEVVVATAVVSPDGKVVRAEYPLLRGSEIAQIRAATERAENWDISVLPVQSDRALVQVGVFASHGEDLFVGEEVVTFLRLESGDLRAIWTGLGDSVDRRFDLCILESKTEFTFVSNGSVRRRTTTERSFLSEDTDEETTKLREDCVGSPPRTKTFALENAAPH